MQDRSRRWKPRLVDGMMNEGAWSGVLEFPIGGRRQKPRHVGLTMVIDKGLGLTEFGDLLEVAAPYIDFIKLGFGTSVFYPAPILREKIRLARSYGVEIFPGGTFLRWPSFREDLTCILKLPENWDTPLLKFPMVLSI